MNDIISDMLTRMRNALAMKYTKVEVLGSKMTKEIATILTNEGYIEGFEAVKELTVIAGQKPVVTKAKKSIAGFKLREGNKIGCKVTLRGERMYVFLEKLINIALPRVRDFRGISKGSFDGRGNYTLGIKEQLIFPEVDYDQVIKTRGLDIVIVTTANTNEEALELLSGFGLPFKK